ncbi:MAG: hypothetical protein WCK21_06820 [Actinomycetota bacterium]
MKIRTRVWRLGLALLTATGAVGATAGHVAAGPLVGPTPGDGSAVVFIASTGAPGLTNGMRYNSSGGDITAGQIDDTHYWVSFLNMGGGTYTNAQLTIFKGSSSATVDPVCTIEKTKDNGTDVTVYFQCNAYIGSTLPGTNLFVTVTNRTHPDRLGVTAPGFVAVTTSDAAVNHTPTNQYRSSGVGAAAVTHLATGMYRVTVPNAAYAATQGVAFATALTVSPAVDTYYSRYCNPQNWYPSGTNMIVNVNCYGGLGDLRDGRFSLRLSARNHMGGAQPGGSQWVSNPASAGYDPVGYGWNSAGGTNHVRSLAPWEGTGSSEITFGGATYAAGKVPSVLVSAYGGNHRCSLEYLGSNPTVGYTFESVRCFVPTAGAGVAGGMYTVSLAQL